MVISSIRSALRTAPRQETSLSGWRFRIMGTKPSPPARGRLPAADPAVFEEQLGRVEE